MAINTNWSTQILQNLDATDRALDAWMPSNRVQNFFDRLDLTIPQLTQINEELEKRDIWPDKELDKIPIKVLRNFVAIPYFATKGVFYLALHPLKGGNQLIRLFVQSVVGLQDEKNWTKIGGGLVGASLGQNLALGLPFATMRLSFGLAIAITGIAIAVFKAENRIDELYYQITDFSVSLLTGMGCGYLIAKVTLHFAAKRAEKLAEKTMKEQYTPIYANRPAWTDVHLDSKGKFHFVISPFHTEVDKNGTLFINHKYGLITKMTHRVQNTHESTITISDTKRLICPHDFASRNVGDFQLHPSFELQNGVPTKYLGKLTLLYTDVSPLERFNFTPVTNTSTASALYGSTMK